MTTSDAAVHRYRDAYTVAGTITGFGSFVKIGSIVLGCIAFLVVLVIAGTVANNAGPYGGGFGGGGMASGLAGATIFIELLTIAVWTLIGYIVGVCIGAYGQMLRAQVDCAVHSSPFMDGGAKASAMGLPDPPP